MAKKTVNKIIAICGRISSGKTTLAKIISEQYKLPIASFGGYIKHYCEKNNLPIDRKSLQDIDTFQWDMEKFTEAYEIWVTELRLEFSQRVKLEHLIEGKGYLSSQFPTPSVSDTDGGETQTVSFRNGRFVRTSNTTGTIFGAKLKDAVQQKWTTPQARDSKTPDSPDSQNFKRKKEKGWTIDLNSQVLLMKPPMKNWPSPMVSDIYTDGLSSTQQKSGSMHSMTLAQAIHKNWPTPNTLDSMAPKTENALQKEITETRKGRNMLSNLRDAVTNPLGVMKNYPTPHASDMEKTAKNTKQNSLIRMEIRGELSSQHLPDKNNMNGKRLVLNPAWVLQLMGTTLEKTFFAWQEMELLNKQPKNHLDA